MENNVIIKDEINNENNDNSKDYCKYCSQSCDPYENPSIQCSGECLARVHVRCLKRGGVPGSLAGDVFFSLFCAECSPLHEETITRDKMSWLNIIILTLYNLREKSLGISKRGYFHWKSDISTFVDKNWDYLFQKTVKRKKNWIGTISGTLSHYSTNFFRSGTTELGESGWWRLVDNDPPEILIERNNRMISERKKPPKSQIKLNLSPPRSESSLSDSILESTRSIAPSMFSMEYVRPSAVLSDFLMADDEIPDTNPTEVDNTSELSLSQALNFNDSVKDYQTASEEKIFTNSNSNWIDKFLIPSQKPPTSPPKPPEAERPSSSQSDRSISPSPCEPTPSLFTSKPKRPLPWLNQESRRALPSRSFLTKPEINYLLQKIPKDRLNSASASVRRIYRKLEVRKLKLDNNLPVLDIDSFTGDGQKKSGADVTGKNRVIDRFHCQNFRLKSEIRLQGIISEAVAIVSPYTNRVLKPFIRRETESQPLWPKLLSELRQKALARLRRISGEIVKTSDDSGGVSTNSGNPLFTSKEFSINFGKLREPPAAPVDYCYVRPQHIPAINSLCERFFWPGIDLSECLHYPDFTCVVLWKKVVVGFAVLVPDVGFNEAYVSFFLVRPEWRRCGIGTFMLYHLIQTCMGKDVTLHASVTNPALILYQKFGFKVEEFVQDFYDKYMAPGPSESRHAVFLRLSR